jgi:hypothetical protein
VSPLGGKMVLYKYYSFDAGLKALRSQKLGFRQARYFNDPFEFSFHHSSDESDNLQQMVNTLSQSLGVLCLTTSPCNPLMWAHYGDEHRGFVIGYDVVDEFFSSDTYNLATASEGTVVYKEEKAQIDFSPGLSQLINRACLRAQGDSSAYFSQSENDAVKKFLNAVLLIKHKIWSYENEVRVVKVLDSVFEETHIQQADPNRAHSTICMNVAPGIAVQCVQGLYLFDKPAKICEVYLGIRNPLVIEKSVVATANLDLVELSKKHSWNVKKMLMKSGTWELTSEAEASDSLALTEKTVGLLSSFEFGHTEARFICESPLVISSSDKDKFRLTNWSGQLHVAKID